jgi:hypothetical protein
MADGSTPPPEGRCRDKGERYPYFEVGGTHYAIGVEIGKQFGWEITQRLERWPQLAGFRERMACDGKSIHDDLLAHATVF